MTKKRVRRVFDATFKIEAVRRMGERKAKRVPMGEIARDLGVPSDLLRRWARHNGGRAGAERTPHGAGDHSDRGSQNAARAYRDTLAAHGMLASMSGKGHCYDNAVAESFSATLEFELIMKNDWATKGAARQAIFRYIETWYNRKRRNSTLGYVSPAEHEVQLREAA